MVVSTLILMVASWIYMSMFSCDSNHILLAVSSAVSLGSVVCLASCFVLDDVDLNHFIENIVRLTCKRVGS